jgi:class 3 adenylate cyclase
MFCDLVGSTRISAGLDAEDWRDLVGTYLDAASAAVTEMGGHVAKKLGDGLMALFGYPVSAGKRCRTRSAGCFVHPTGTRRTEPYEGRQWQARAPRTHRD